MQIKDTTVDTTDPSSSLRSKIISSGSSTADPWSIGRVHRTSVRTVWTIPMDRAYHTTNSANGSYSPNFANMDHTDMDHTVWTIPWTIPYGPCRMVHIVWFIVCSKLCGWFFMFQWNNFRLFCSENYELKDWHFP